MVRAWNAAGGKRATNSLIRLKYFEYPEEVPYLTALTTTGSVLPDGLPQDSAWGASKKHQSINFFCRNQQSAVRADIHR